MAKKKLNQRKLNQRIKARREGYAAMIARLAAEHKSTAGYHRPGSGKK